MTVHVSVHDQITAHLISYYKAEKRAVVTLQSHRTADAGDKAVRTGEVSLFFKDIPAAIALFEQVAKALREGKDKAFD